MSTAIFSFCTRKKCPNHNKTRMNLFGGPSIPEDDETLIRSKKWADTVIDMPDWEVHDVDRPYVKALLVAAHMFEKPLKDLPVAIESSPNNYKICISGYSQMHSIPLTYRTFFDPARRGKMLDQVEDGSWQPAKDGGGLIMTFIVRKMHFKTAQKSGTGSMGSVRRFKKRD